MKICVSVSTTEVLLICELPNNFSLMCIPALGKYCMFSFCFLFFVFSGFCLFVFCFVFVFTPNVSTFDLSAVGLQIKKSLVCQMMKLVMYRMVERAFTTRKNYQSLYQSCLICFSLLRHSFISLS